MRRLAGAFDHRADGDIYAGADNDAEAMQDQRAKGQNAAATRGRGGRMGHWESMSLTARDLRRVTAALGEAIERHSPSPRRDDLAQSRRRQVRAGG